MVEINTKTGRAAFAGALLAVAVGLSILAGWLFDLDSLKHLARGPIAVNPATAVAFICAGGLLALLLQSARGLGHTARPRIARALDHERSLAPWMLPDPNQALPERGEKSWLLADSDAEVFWISSPDMRGLRYVSPAYEQIWGLSPESLYAHPNQWAEAILPVDRARVDSTFARLAVDAPRATAEFRIARPDGTVRWILSRGFQVRDAAGQVVRVTGMARDITERKRSEADAETAHREREEAAGQAGGAGSATRVLPDVST